MSSFNLAKKLHPAKKAWKSFTKTLQSKLQKLKISKAVKKTTRRLKSLRSTRPLIPRKLRALTRHCSRRDYHRCHRRLHHQLEKSMEAIYVDEFFAGPVSSHAKQIHLNQETSSRKGENKAKVEGKTMTNVEIIDEKVLSRKSKVSETSRASAVANAGKLVAVSSFPQLQGIDERAEEFISKFHEDMKLQREQSILDFQEMLARSA